MNNQWLKNIKAGDTVILESGGYYGGASVEKVERLTKTQIVLKSGGKFRRDSGNMVGGDAWSRSQIREPTEDGLNAIRKAVLVRKLKAFKWDELDLQTLRDIYARTG